MTPKPIPRAEHFTHYAVQWAPCATDALGGRHIQTYKHFDLAGDDGTPGGLAVFRTKEAAEACLASVAADLPPHIATRIVRYHTSGYTDVVEVPEAPKPTGYFDEPDEPPAAPKAKRHVPKPIEVID